MDKGSTKIRCYFPQYYCCGNKQCSLYETCSKLPYLYIPISYRRQNSYQWIDKKTSKEKEEHNKRYYFYNCFFGDLKERRSKINKRYYNDNKELLCEKQKIRYRKSHPKKDINDCDNKPNCQLDCFNCPYPDCVLPLNWKKQQSHNNWCQNNPNYFAEYREKNREELRQKNKNYYKNNKDTILQKRKEHRAKPEIKEKRKEYDTKYRNSHKEQIKIKQQRYYEKHKDKINAKKRAKRQQLRKEREL